MVGPLDMNDLGRAKLLSEGTVTAGEVTTVIYRYVTGHPYQEIGHIARTSHNLHCERGR